jgi:hypothetical protein
MYRLQLDVARARTAAFFIYTRNVSEVESFTDSLNSVTMPRFWWSRFARPLSELNYEYTLRVAAFKIDGYQEKWKKKSRRSSFHRSVSQALGGEKVIKGTCRRKVTKGEMLWNDVTNCNVYTYRHELNVN